MSSSNRLRLSVGAGLVCFAIALPAHATAILNIYNDGTGNVVSMATGEFDLTDLTFEGFANQPEFLEANQGALISGSFGVYAVYDTISGPHSWGSGGLFDASSVSGNLFGLDGAFGDLVVPRGYTSGTGLSSGDVFFSSSIDGLGLTPGTYTYTWGQGGDADSLVVNISETAPGQTPPAPTAPEPGTALLGITGIGAAIALSRTRTKVAK